MLSSYHVHYARSSSWPLDGNLNGAAASLMTRPTAPVSLRRLTEALKQQRFDPKVHIMHVYVCDMINN